MTQSEVKALQAPHLWPGPKAVSAQNRESGAVVAPSAPLYYLSWPGWELYLSRRLGLEPTAGGKPLLLANQLDPERDFAVIDQLVQRVAELGTGVLALLEPEPESFGAISSALRHYSPAASTSTGPHLDDRCLLALWNVAEFNKFEARRLLSLSVALEQEMWQDLKGVDFSDEDEEEMPPAPLPEVSDTSPGQLRSVWLSWRRLAAPFLADPAQFVVWPTATDPAAEGDQGGHPAAG